MRSVRRKKRDADPSEALRAWRLAANNLHVEAAECRESLRRLVARAHGVASRQELVDGVMSERRRIAGACQELLTGLGQVHQSVRRASERAQVRERDEIEALRRSMATYIRRRTSRH